MRVNHALVLCLMLSRLLTMLTAVLPECTETRHCNLETFSLISVCIRYAGEHHRTGFIYAESYPVANISASRTDILIRIQASVLWCFYAKCNGFYVCRIDFLPRQATSCHQHLTKIVRRAGAYAFTMLLFTSKHATLSPVMNPVVRLHWRWCLQTSGNAHSLYENTA